MMGITETLSTDGWQLAQQDANEALGDSSRI